MARASIYTLLSLDRFAKIMGINPMHFAGATTNGFFPLRNKCGDLWVQHSWQWEDPIGREELAEEIYNAERDIARQLGWWPAPVWRSQDVRDYVQHYRRDAYPAFGRNIRHAHKGIKTEFARVIAGGRRGAIAVSEGATVTYTDEDGDGFFETATVTAATTLTDVFELFVFTAGKSGAAQWEIRPPRSKSISGGVVTFTFWSWQMIDPDVWEEFPTDASIGGEIAIDLNGLTEDPVVTTNLVLTVDVYRIYNDTTENSALFMWEPTPKGTIIGTGWGCCSQSECEACGFTTQGGCLTVRHPLEGIVVPAPATYSDGSWSQDSFDECRDPDLVKLWYYSGYQSNDYRGGYDYDMLSNRWAKAISQLAVARLERPLCNCANTVALAAKWQMDTALIPNALNVSLSEMDNPFGTRYGEILAWRQVKNEKHIIRGGGVVG